MGDTTPLALPPDLPYPVTITRLVASVGDHVRRGDKLLEYSFLSATKRSEVLQAEQAGRLPQGASVKNDMVGSWDCPIAGEVVAWVQDIQAGARIEQRRGSKPIVRIEQPCTHPVQFNGMCGVCGADIVPDDYLSRTDQAQAGPSRYPGSFELAHDSSGVTVSTNEAKRLETMTRDTLLSLRKLSLIVDLDQTIIHTTVDPTVGKWMEECEEDQREEKAAMETDEGEKGEDGTTTPTGSPPAALLSSKREKNPNAEALKDVAKFELPDDLPPGVAAGVSGPMRSYYTKPRPGLCQFLKEQSQLYEMHVYTMGTRTYADAICKIIDPDGKYFGGRILSRDESGSMKAKNLSRLFPTDQSMVVIIDDRADVWGDSPNLVKVVPYDFFIGIGDINGSFLPPTRPTISAMPGQSPTPSADSSSSAASSPMPDTPTDIPSTEDGLLLQSKILDEMANNRPLEQLEQKTSEEQDTEANAEGAGEDAVMAGGSSNAEAAPEHHVEHKPRKALLNDNDHELTRVGGILTRIHSDYYQAYSTRDQSSSTLPMACDTPLLIQEIKDQVLSGCTIAFTGVIPRNTDPESSDIWRTTEEFGAVCVHELNDKVTHLVTASLGTEKMYRAEKMPSTKTVWLAWLQSSIALWNHEPEEPFLAQQSQLPTEAAAESPNPATQPEEEERAEIEQAAGLWGGDEQDDFEKWLGSESDGEGGDEKASEAGEGDSGSDGDDEYHRWSRASTPARSILSRAGSRSPSPGPSRHVRYADEENLPLERVREPRPGEIVSYPPRKKRKLLMLGAPSDDDDIPEANKMVYRPNGHEDSGSDTATEGEDEFAKMLSDTLADTS